MQIANCMSPQHANLCRARQFLFQSVPCRRLLSHCCLIIPCASNLEKVVSSAAICLLWLGAVLMHVAWGPGVLPSPVGKTSHSRESRARLEKPGSIPQLLQPSNWRASQRSTCKKAKPGNTPQLLRRSNWGVGPRALPTIFKPSDHSQRTCL